MPVDSALYPIPDNSSAPDSPYRSATVRSLIGQTQCAGMRMTGNSKVFCYVPMGSTNIALVGSTAYTFDFVPWHIQTGYDSIVVDVMFGVRVPQPLQFRANSRTLIDAIATTTGEWTPPVFPGEPVDNNNNWDDEPLLFGSASMVVVPSEIPASRRVEIQVQFMIDNTLIPQQATSSFALYRRQILIRDRRQNG